MNATQKKTGALSWLFAIKLELLLMGDYTNSTFDLYVFKQ